MTDEQLLAFAEKWRCTHPGCIDWFDMAVDKFLVVARAIEQASRRAALEEAALFMESRALAMENGTHIGGTMARIYRDEADAIRSLATGDKA